MDHTTILKSPLKVICVYPKSSIKLIKGGEYYAIELYDTGASTNKEKRVLIKGLTYYSAINFKLENGDYLYVHDTFIVKSKTLDTDNIDYTGQYVRCNRSSSIQTKEGAIYYVELQFKKRQRGYTFDYHYLKLRGINKNMYSYQFDEISISEQRKLKLDNINGIQIETGNIRKFTQYSEKEKLVIFLEGLSKSLSDINKTQNSDKIVTNIYKSLTTKCKKYDVIEKDFEEFLKLDIKTILEIYNIKI